MTRTIADLRRAATTLVERRRSAEKSEAELVAALNSFCRGSYGQAAEIASKISISKVYMSDVMIGKRGVSDQLAEKLAELK